MKRHKNILARSFAWVMALAMVGGLLLPGVRNFASSDVFQTQEVSQTVDIDADLKLGSDTGNNTITVQKADNMDFVGVINAKTIKDQMAQIEANYGTDADKIALSNLKTGLRPRSRFPMS